MAHADAALLNTEPATGNDIHALLASLRGSAMAPVDAVNRLLAWSASETHPQLRAQMLELAARMAEAGDRTRAIGLLRESYRTMPQRQSGERLVALAATDPAQQRLFRLGNLVDANAALVATGAAGTAAWLEAAHHHVAQGHGRAARRAIGHVLAASPGHAEASDLLTLADQQIEDRGHLLQAQRLALAECDDGERAEALLAYAELLLHGDEPLQDAAAVLADAADAGAPVDVVAPLWVEVARAMADEAELVRALSCALQAGEALPSRLQHADELANVGGVDRRYPHAAALALSALAEALPDDPPIAARLSVVSALLDDGAATALETLRQVAVESEDVLGETTACLALGWLAWQGGDWQSARAHYARVAALDPSEPEAQQFRAADPATQDAMAADATSALAAQTHVAEPAPPEAPQPQPPQDGPPEVAAAAAPVPRSPEEQLQHALDNAMASGASPAIEQALRSALAVDPTREDWFEQLEALLDGEGRFDDVLSLWQARLVAAADDDQRRIALHRVAGLARALRQQVVALDAYRALADLDPTDSGPLGEAAEVLRELNDTSGLLEVLPRLARLTAAEADRCALLCEAARLQPSDRTGQDRAELLYREALELQPSADEPFAWLERYVHAHPRQLASLIDRRVRALPVGHARTASLRKLAHAQLRAGEAAAACAALLAASDEDPANTAVVDELLQTAEAQHQWPMWQTAAQRRLEQGLPDEARVQLLAQLARVSAVELADGQQAQVALDALVKVAPTAAATRQVQALLFAQRGQPDEAATALEHAIEATRAPHEQLPMYLQLVDLYAGELDQSAKAIRALQHVLAIDPRRHDERRRLCDLYRGREAFEALAEALRQWLAALDDNRVRGTLQMAQGREMADLLRELGEVLVLLGQPQEAMRQLRLAYELGGHDPQVDEALAPLLEAAAEWDAAAQLYEWLAGHEARNRAVSAGYWAKAGVALESGGRTLDAAARFRQALQVKPDAADALAGLARTAPPA